LKKSLLKERSKLIETQAERSFGYIIVLISLLLLYPSFAQINDDEFEGIPLTNLVNDDPAKRARAGKEIRSKLIFTNVHLLLSKMDDMPYSISKAVKEILASGGSWNMALIEALGSGDEKAAGNAYEILVASAGYRPICNEFPSPDQMETSPIDPFGNGAVGEGVALYFPGIWPESVNIIDLLDSINENAAPTFPFVLSPRLAIDTGLNLADKPIEGPAPLVIDRLLGPLLLGVTYLESVALVEEKRSSVLNQFHTNRKEDKVLLTIVLDVLSDKDAAKEVKSAAMRALAYLDLPGIFEGCYQSLSEKFNMDWASFLLHGPSLGRLRTRLAEDRDIQKITTLFRIYDMIDKDSQEGEKLLSLLIALPKIDVQKSFKQQQKVDAAWNHIFLEDGKQVDIVSIRLLLCSKEKEKIRLGVKAVESAIHNEPELARLVVNEFIGHPTFDTDSTRLFDRCIVDVLAPWINDTECASLIKNPHTRKTGIELSYFIGHEASLNAIIKLINEGGPPNKDWVSAAVFLYKLLSPQFNGDQVWEMACDSGLDRSARVGAAGIAAGRVLSKKYQNEAACLLIDSIRNGTEQEAIAAVDMFSFFKDGAITAHLKPLIEALAKQDNKNLFIAAQRSILSAAACKGLTPERIRLTLRKIGWPDEKSSINEYLNLLATLSSMDSLQIAVKL